MRFLFKKAYSLALLIRLGERDLLMFKHHARVKALVHLTYICIRANQCINRFPCVSICLQKRKIGTGPLNSAAKIAALTLYIH